MRIWNIGFLRRWRTKRTGVTLPRGIVSVGSDIVLESPYVVSRACNLKTHFRLGAFSVMTDSKAEGYVDNVDWSDVDKSILAIKHAIATGVPIYRGKIYEGRTI